ncbi:hypothetical protein P3X46_003321 [Hevea brasiliensis]|uniref:Hexosyltransferase n=1 Tax=Hevea brasiliensis TaxID=3981 RepID=A0ABQ9N5V9_HEVBR|nr:hypothetical protein P3X46_003321 [Hevea brasiliensis]
MYFEDIYKPIPLVYNLVLAMLWRHPENVELDKVKVVHYCAAGSKPWRYTGKEENMQREDIRMLVKKWWDIYNDESLNYKKPVGDGDAEPVNLQPFIAAVHCSSLRSWCRSIHNSPICCLKMAVDQRAKAQINVYILLVEVKIKIKNKNK